MSRYGIRLFGFLAAIFWTAVLAIAIEPPNYLRAVSDQKDVGAVNENDRALSDGIRQVDERVDDLPTLSGNNAWTGNQTFAGSSTFNDPAVFNDSVTVNARAAFNGDVVGPQIIQAWAHFVGTGTVVLYDSVGVSSVTDIGNGDYRVNFSTPFANGNFLFGCTIGYASAASILCARNTAEADTKSVRVSVISGTTANPIDVDRVNLMIVGRR